MLTTRFYILFYKYNNIYGTLINYILYRNLVHDRDGDEYNISNTIYIQIQMNHVY